MALIRYSVNPNPGPHIHVWSTRLKSKGWRGYAGRMGGVGEKGGGVLPYMYMVSLGKSAVLPPFSTPKLLGCGCFSPNSCLGIFNLKNGGGGHQTG